MLGVLRCGAAARPLRLPLHSLAVQRGPRLPRVAQLVLQPVRRMCMSSELRKELSFLEKLKASMVKHRTIRLPFGRPIETSISDVFGNTSFVLLGVSFVFTDILWLRGLALLAGASMAVFNFFHPYGKILWLPLRWNLFFIGVNLVNIVIILRERRQAELITTEAKALYEDVFAPHGLSLVDYHKLIKGAKWRHYNTGDKLTSSGKFNHEVFLVYSGNATVVLANGQHVYTLHSSSFVGEMGLHVGLRMVNPPKSSATVVVTKPLTALVWSRGNLIDVIENNPDVARVMLAATSADLLRKLSRPIKTTADEESRQGIRFTWYNNIVHQLLGEAASITRHDRNILKRFRRLHHISPEEHKAAIEAAGWSVAQFKAGRK